HAIDPIPSLVSLYRFEQFGRFEEDIVLANLGTLAAAIDDPAKYKGLNAFVNATAAATNRLMQRQTRFKFFCNALEPELL
ncbi:MAG TPA: hypothetical protein VMT24_03500, partial [Aggregatilineaceae bacterium]|nr:hypothetical protein [Aggregatilineaceae bacterium]